MNIGLTGSSGVLGNLLKKKLNLKKKNLFSGKIENLNHVNNWIKINDFDFIIHLAAVVPIKTVNKNKIKALSINYSGTKNLINSINNFSKKKIWFFYSSTSHVYNFKKSQIYETDKTKPISFYGQTKFAGTIFFDTETLSNLCTRSLEFFKYPFDPPLGYAVNIIIVAHCVN